MKNKVLLTIATLCILLFGCFIIGAILYLLNIQSRAIAWMLSGVWGYMVAVWYESKA